MKPFLKWAGGKRWIIPKIYKSLPPFKTYYEPFLGGGSLFFSLEPSRAVLSDTNKELINCYRCIRNRCKKVLTVLRDLKKSKDDYYQIRDKFNSKEDPIKKAAYFIYLTKTCWNGLYRVNRDGRFNVPIGKFRDGFEIFNEEQLLYASKVLKKAELRHCDFEEGIKGIKTHDIVYFDPPYITTHQKNGFAEYNAKLFSQTDELRLAALAEKLCGKNVYVIVSNAAHPIIKQQYNGSFYKTEVERASLIAGDPARRSRFTELIITNFSLEQENLCRENMRGE